jgi:hypothetical protein
VHPPTNEHETEEASDVVVGAFASVVAIEAH